MTSLGVGIVGCGYWGINYVRVFSELPEAQVLVVCDTDPSRLKRVRQRFPLVRTTTVLSELLTEPDLMAVVVATPSSTHYQLVRQCLLRDKHVLVEKPLVLQVAEGLQLLDLADARDCILMVGHTFLFNPGVQAMKDQIDKEDFGEIYYLHSTRTNLGPIRKDANVLWDLAPHDVAIFDYLLDTRPVQATAIGARALRNGREDVGFITLTYPGGILGHIHVSWIDPNKVREVVVVGSRKRLVFNDLYNQDRLRIYEKGVAPVQSEVDSFGEFRLQIRDGEIVSPSIDPGEPLKNQCIHFLECIANQSVPLSNGQNGLDVVKAILAMQESMRLQGSPVPIGE